MHDMSAQLQGPLSELVNRFIYEVQVPVVARRRVIMEETFGIYHPANTNVLNYDHIPLSLVPDSMITQGRVMSLWRGRPKASTTTTVAVRTTDAADNTAAAAVPPNLATPSRSTKSNQPILSPESDTAWFASPEVAFAVDLVSAKHMQKNKGKEDKGTPLSALRTPMTPSRTTASRASQLVRFAAQPAQPGQTLTGSSNDLMAIDLSDSDGEDSLSKPLPISALRLHARPNPFTAQQLDAHAQQMALVTAFSTAAPTLITLPTLPSNANPASEGDNHEIVATSPSSVSSLGVSTLAESPPLLAPLTPSSYGGFNPIVPPGPYSEHWLFEHGWPMQWANVLRTVAEEHTCGKWVHVLVEEYGVGHVAAEAIRDCIMADYEHNRLNLST
jgi:hypothetical protein